MATAAPSPSLHRIVVVGGGAGGIELVTRLGDTLGRSGRADIALVEKARTHLWKPLLHEVAAGSMDVSRHELDYLAQAYWHGFRFRLGEMIGLDRARRVVNLAAKLDEDGRLITPVRSIGYDTLVIAIGSVSNDFGTPGVKEHAICLDTPEEAARFNRRLVNACLRAHTQAEPVRPGQLHVAIIGAGATGTELSAELHRTVRGVVAFGLDKIDPDKDIKITLIEAADRLVPALPKRLSDATARLLARARRGDADRRARDRGRPGRRASRRRRLHSLGARGVVGRRARPGRAEEPRRPGGERVGSARGAADLQTTRDDNVFAMGDCAYLVPDGEKRPIPPRAQAAHQQASHLLKQLRRRLEGEPSSRSSTTTSARWCRSANSRRSAA